MTNSILHAFRKLLRFSVLLIIISSAATNASAQGNIPGLCSASCNAQLNVSLDASGYALIDPVLVWEEGYNLACFPLLDQIVVEIAGAEIVVEDVTAHGHTVSTTSALLDCGDVGSNLQYQLIKYYSDGTVNSCWGNVLIEDKQLPNITCTDLFVNCTDNTDPFALASFYNNSIPTASDNCGTPIIDFVDTEEDFACTNPNFLRKITRVWTATDASGNERECTQTVYVQKADGASIVFPGNLDDITGVALSCPNANTNTSATGFPTLNGLPLSADNVCKFSVDHQDLTIDAPCGGSYEIIRTWTILNWCTSDIYTHNQIIKVADKVAPSISCPSIPQLGTNTTSCTGTVFLPAASVSDACSNFTVTTTTPNGVLNGNGGLVVGLAIGTHDITYTATDECGNSNSCTTTITIADIVPPTAICDEHTTISLINDGTAIAYATTFDDGSHDNCGIASMQVRRLDNPDCPGNDASSFDDYVSFSCCDIGSVVMVQLQITDESGNSNSCMIEVELEDKLDPVVICPTDKTLACKSDFTNLGITGEATATDNCTGISITHQDIDVNIDQCGVGSVTRIWTATDAEGNTSSCTQTIYLVNNDPFDANDFSFPLDYNSNGCQIGGLSPDELPAPFNEPVISDDVCDLVAVTYTDEFLPIAAPACFKILRKWVIVDWCQYDPNYVSLDGETPGRWEHVQVIKVTDNEAPVFTVCPGNLFIDNFEPNCGSTYVNLFVQATDCSDELDYTYAIDVNNDGSNDIFGNGNDASGAFTNGVYNIIFSVTDGCGNISNCSFLFTVKDGKKPTPVCLNGLSSDLMPSTSMVTIWASDFESGSSFDNCTAYENLQFSFSSNVNDNQRTFTCNELGTQTVDLWVTDAEGNQDFCSTYIIIQDNNGVCGGPTAAIQGGIENENGEEIEDVTIEVAGSNAIPYVTGANGSFAFPSLPVGSNYTITPAKDMNHLNGVTTFDLVLISKHILGIDLLDSPYKAIAADANQSGSVTTLDIVQIRKLILHIDDELQSSDSWRFVDANFVFSDANNPFADDFPEAIDVNNLTIDEAANFLAIKVGDVNSSAIPNQLLGSETRNKVATLSLDVDAATVKAGESTTVDFKAKDFNKMIGFQFTLTFDATTVSFEDVVSGIDGLNSDNFGFTRLDEGVITVSWNHNSSLTLDDETVLFSLVFNGKSTAELSDVIGITSTVTAAEAYSKSNTSSQGTSDVMDIQLTFNGVTTTDENQLLQNRPNPVTSSTVIPFQLVEGGEVTLKVIDINGKTVRVVRGDYAKGYNEINLTNLKGSGVMYYQLETGSETLVKKMILINK